MPLRVSMMGALRLSAAACSLLLASCAAPTAFYRDVDAGMAAGKYDEAIATVRSNRQAYGEKASVLYRLDMGALFHYAGNPDSSSVYLLAAEREIGDLYTKSISAEALAFVLNDNVLPYDGEDFERVLVNVYLALNFAAKGLPDEAVVEARKVDLKLKDYARQYQGKNAYQEDAFARYLSGILYESTGEINDAFIAYQKAHEAYALYESTFGTPEPPFLLNDLVRTARMLAFTEEAERYRALGGAEPAAGSARPGSVVVIAYAGLGPVKIEERPSVSIADESGTIHTFQVALPRFLPRMKGSRTYDITVERAADSSQAATGRTVLAEDVTAIAGKVLEDRLGLIYLKSGGRALLKFLAAEKAKSAIKQKSGNDGKTETNGDRLTNFLSSLAIDLVVGATEAADLRTWRTLPAQFQISRIFLPAGEYRMHASSQDGGYRMTQDSVRVHAGKSTFVLLDDLR
jgi:uncharacterized protein